MGRILITVLAILLFPFTAEAAFILTYTGTFDRVGNDPAGVNGASFIWTAEFDMSPYVDNTLGDPSLALDRLASTFVVSGASDISANGDYSQPFTLSMMPALGGAMATIPSNPPHFIRGGLRFSANVIDMFGGDGLGTLIGDTPLLSHFPTDISSPTMRALPHNVVYNVIDSSISLSPAVPEPASMIVWALLSLSVVAYRLVSTNHPAVRYLRKG